MTPRAKLCLTCWCGLCLFFQVPTSSTGYPVLGLAPGFRFRASGAGNDGAHGWRAKPAPVFRQRAGSESQAPDNRCLTLAPASNSERAGQGATGNPSVAGPSPSRFSDTGAVPKSSTGYPVLDFRLVGAAVNFPQPAAAYAAGAFPNPPAFSAFRGRFGKSSAGYPVLDFRGSKVKHRISGA